MTVSPDAQMRPSWFDAMAVYFKPRVLIVLLLGFSAGARSAIVDLLDLIPGVRLERVSTLPPAQLRQDVVFGRPSSLAAAPPPA